MIHHVYHFRLHWKKDRLKTQKQTSKNFLACSLRPGQKFASVTTDKAHRSSGYKYNLLYYRNEIEMPAKNAYNIGHRSN
jgi:hypothetical protein